MAKMYRQGDVLLIKTDLKEIPKKAEKVKETMPGKTVLALGEVTGHHHRIDSKLSSMYMWEGDRLVETKAGATIIHEEHDPIAVDPGIWRVKIMSEYSPGTVRQTAD